MKQTTLMTAWSNRQPEFTSERASCNNSRIEGYSTAVDCDFNLPLTVNVNTTASDFVRNGGDSNDSDFDRLEGKYFDYPSNFSVRSYQFEIIKECVYRNTLVCLPTGLGKTFIASVVIHNFFRWFPNGKFVFTAPTKPLVSQQMKACERLSTIPLDEIVEMTGSLPSDKRKLLWQEKRLFFLTPQVIMNDLSTGICPGTPIKCLVIDEAHRATKNHAYVQTIRLLYEKTQSIRFLGLTATPGNDIHKVQDVINNLRIAHIELRTDECPDIKKYSFLRNVDRIVVPIGAELLSVQEKIDRVLEKCIERLKTISALNERHTAKTIRKLELLERRDKFISHENRENISKECINIAYKNFAVAMTLCHAQDLLHQYGLRSVYKFLQSHLYLEKKSTLSRDELMRMPEFISLWDVLEGKCSSVQNDGSADASHPKFSRLLQLLKDYFEGQSCATAKHLGKVIVFTQFRESVQEIMKHISLLQSDLVKPVCLVGHSKTVQGIVTSGGKPSNAGLGGKQQRQILQHFREGVYNVLISTCVGEEGLDIGEVDLIICFDAHRSPIRLIQRIGRTGRQRSGRVVMLLTAGREENNYNTSVARGKTINKAIFRNYNSLRFFSNNPRLFPLDAPPPLLRFIDMVRRRPVLTTPLTGKRNGKGSGKRQSTDTVPYSQTMAVQNTYPRLPNPLMNSGCLSIKDDDFNDLGRLMHPLKYRSVILQPVHAVGHSTLCQNVLSVLNVAKKHRQGLTNVLFHAMGRRSIELDNHEDSCSGSQRSESPIFGATQTNLLRVSLTQTHQMDMGPPFVSSQVERNRFQIFSMKGEIFNPFVKGLAQLGHIFDGCELVSKQYTLNDFQKVKLQWLSDLCCSHDSENSSENCAAWNDGESCNQGSPFAIDSAVDSVNELSDSELLRLVSESPGTTLARKQADKRNPTTNFSMESSDVQNFNISIHLERQNESDDLASQIMGESPPINALLSSRLSENQVSDVDFIAGQQMDEIHYDTEPNNILLCSVEKKTHEQSNGDTVNLCDEVIESSVDSSDRLIAKSVKHSSFADNIDKQFDLNVSSFVNLSQAFRLLEDNDLLVDNVRPFSSTPSPPPKQNLTASVATGLNTNFHLDLPNYGDDMFLVAIELNDSSSTTDIDFEAAERDAIGCAATRESVLLYNRSDSSLFSSYKNISRKEQSAESGKSSGLKSPSFLSTNRLHRKQNERTDSQSKPRPLTKIKEPKCSLEKSVYIDNSDDDFVLSTSAITKRDSIPKRQRVRRQASARDFLLTQAEHTSRKLVADDTDSDAEENELDGDLDRYEESFIDDSDFVNDPEVAEANCHAIYLKSLRNSTSHRPLRSASSLDLHTKERGGVGFIFSQQADQSESYAFDSFCVKSDDDIDDYSAEDVDDLIVPARTRLQAKRQPVLPAHCQVRPKSKRRRVMLNDSVAGNQSEQDVADDN